MDNLLKNYVKYVSLNILGMVSIAICIFIDTYFISKALGVEGLTALNLAIPIYSTLNGIGLMLGVGGGARYASLKAGKRQQEANKVFTTALITGMVIAAIWMSIGLLFAKPIASAFGAEGQVLIMTTGCLQILLFLCPGLILSNTLAGFMRNDEKPRLAMISTIILSVLNVVFDYLFIFILDLGMGGAALATSLASICSLLFLLACWWSNKTNLSWVRGIGSLKRVKEICETGAPALIGELSSAIVMTAFNLIILNLKGNVGVAAFGIVANLSFIVIAIFTGISQGMQPLISLYYGQNKKKPLRTIFQYSLLTVTGFAVLTYGISFFFTDTLTSIFNQEQDLTLATLANEGVKLYFIGFLFVGFNVISTTFLSITGHVRMGLTLSLLRGGVLIVPLVMIFANLWGIVGVWLSYPVAELLIMIISSYYLVGLLKPQGSV